MKRFLFMLLFALALTFPTASIAPQAASAAYVLNTNTKKFHKPSCSSVSQMKAKNRQDTTMSYDEIIAKGYSPCKNCNPTPESGAAASAGTAGAANSLKTSTKTAAAGASATGASQGGGSKTSEITYVLNTNTRKFHYPSCSSVGTIKEKNRKDSGKSREQLINEGYVPCKRCNP